MLAIPIYGSITYINPAAQASSSSGELEIKQGKKKNHRPPAAPATAGSWRGAARRPPGAGLGPAAAQVDPLPFSAMTIDEIHDRFQARCCCLDLNFYRGN